MEGAGAESNVASEVEARAEESSSAAADGAGDLDENDADAEPGRGEASTPDPVSQRWSPRACNCRAEDRQMHHHNG